MNYTVKIKSNENGVKTGTITYSGCIIIPFQIDREGEITRTDGKELREAARMDISRARK